MDNFRDFDDTDANILSENFEESAEVPQKMSTKCLGQSVYKGEHLIVPSGYTFALPRAAVCSGRVG